MKNIYWAGINLVPNIGNKTLRRLNNYFKNGEEIWNATATELKNSNCLTQKTLSELIEFRQKISLDELKMQLQQYEIKICIEDDVEYPKILKEIFNPPFILYYQGTLPKDELCIGIVGSRKATPYGEQIAQMMACNLAKANFTIVSGAASGIDTKAHLGALKYGRTIAVLGCGLDIVYPAKNKQLLKDIIKKGAVISEYPLGTKPFAGNFPARNRIISGLSKGILVVEATRKSGSLITAELALSEGRDVFAVPGNIYSLNSQGCHKLIQQGAKLVVNANDIIEEYQISLKNSELSNINEKNIDITLSNDEQLIYKCLSFSEPKSTDEIIYEQRINISNIAFILLQMKLKGLIIETSPNFYIRATRECVE